MSRLDVLVSRQGKDGKSYFTKVGAAFPTKGGGYSVVLDALPLDGKLLLLPPREQRDSRSHREPEADGWGDAKEPSDDFGPGY